VRGQVGQGTATVGQVAAQRRGEPLAQLQRLHRATHASAHRAPPPLIPEVSPLPGRASIRARPLPGVSLDTLTGMGMTIRDRLASGAATFSFEFFPPKTDEDERILWRTIRQLEPLNPTFVSVTYGAGGHTRDRTVEVTERIATDTTLLPMAHLTAVNHSVRELRHIIGRFAAAGIVNLLALRGDPPGDPQGEWVKHAEGLEYA